MTGKILVLSTCGSAEEASRVARALVEQRLAACVSIVSKVTSVYQWQNAVEQGEEWMLLIKSRRDLFPRLAEAVRSIHSYEVPELIALDVVDGLESYLGWMDRELAPDGTEAGGA